MGKGKIVSRTEFTYRVDSTGEFSAEFCLRQAHDHFRSSTVYLTRTEDYEGEDHFVLSHPEKELEIDSQGTAANAMWGFSIDGMTLVRMSRIFENACLPLPEKEIEKTQRLIGGYIPWRNGELLLGAVMIAEQECTITCLPSARTVRVDIIAAEGKLKDNDNYRLEFFRRCHKIELMIKLVRAATQLNQAYRTKPKNSGFIDRSNKELFGEIGDVLY
ncbi:MAG: hypothetical protein PHQ47_02715 [Candidatus Portnoybacteria bacterium]|nr:hypothetical protein [Candidatus Portnoybacteria bacterium]